jgi:hypothetical protein
VWYYLIDVDEVFVDQHELLLLIEEEKVFEDLVHWIFEAV